MPSRVRQLLNHAVTLLGQILISLLLHTQYEILIARRVASNNKQVTIISPMLDGDCGTNSEKPEFARVNLQSRIGAKAETGFGEDGYGFLRINLQARMGAEDGTDSEEAGL